jgi:hypothetical protein
MLLPWKGICLTKEVNWDCLPTARQMRQISHDGEEEETKKQLGIVFETLIVIKKGWTVAVKFDQPMTRALQAKLIEKGFIIIACSTISIPMKYTYALDWSQ